MKRSILSVLAYTMLGNLRKPQFCLPYDAVSQADACDVNVNGMSDTVWFITRKNITTYPTAKTATTSDDIGQMENDYAVAVGKPFTTLQHDVEVSNFKCEGVAPGVGPFKVSCDIFVRGNKDVANGFAAQALYDEMVFVVKLADGTRRPIGNADFPARVKPMFDSKAVGATDPRGWHYQIEAWSKYPEVLAADSIIPLT